MQRAHKAACTLLMQCSCKGSCVGLLMCWLGLGLGLAPRPARAAGGVACTTPATYTTCPTALAAAQLLTGNSTFLPVTGASWGGSTGAVCTWSRLLIGDFGCTYLAASMPAGALVLSNGNASIAAAAVNLKDETSTAYNGTASFPNTLFQDADMMALSSGAYGQPLYDGIILEFTLTPRGTGSLVFAYVWGSEEYPSFAPATGSKSFFP